MTPAGAIMKNLNRQFHKNHRLMRITFVGFHYREYIGQL